MLTKPCVYCGKKAAAMDHATVKWRGGTDLPDNLNPVCDKDNIRKGSYTDDEYRRVLAGEHIIRPRGPGSRRRHYERACKEAGVTPVPIDED
jgi:5-methylcytosine-specific restriction endonuclease McrA